MTQTAKPVDTDPLQSIYNIQDFHCSPATLDGAFILIFLFHLLNFLHGRAIQLDSSTHHETIERPLGEKRQNYRAYSRAYR